MLPKILIVDDSKTIRMQLREMLPKGNFEISEAKDGVEGYALINQERPSLVLLDFFMPHMNGWEVLKKIKAQPELHTIPVVVITGRKEEVLERVPDLFTHYACIEKPFEQKTLMEAVRSALAKAKSRQSTKPAEPVTSPQTDSELEDIPALKAQVKKLTDAVHTLTDANNSLHSEIDLLKKQMARLSSLVRQKITADVGN